MKNLGLSFLRITSGLCLLAAAASTLAPSRAAACGGTFCDAVVPGPMPVDQTGESVIFVIGGPESEVHIQISYDPDTNAENFGWLIPLSAVPKFTVGSQMLFDQIRLASVPQYDIVTSFETCETTTDDFQPTSSGGGGFPTSGDPGSGDSDDGGDDGPTVLLQETVGAFDVVVLTDKEIQPIRQWLEDNGYLWDAKAEPILMQYLAEGNVIAALKLHRTSGPSDVHPITLTYPANETCFPLRLTRIAAVEDMDIRVFVLGETRAAPTNYRHVLVNPLKIDWMNRASNYKDVISQAVDALKADGRAFVTEYAGPSSIVDRSAVVDFLWNEASFVGLDPLMVTETLNGQGLANCYAALCEWPQPVVLGLLLEHLPPPAGVEANDFYADLAAYSDQIDVAKWNDGAGFAAGLRARVIDPGVHANDLLKTWPYLTRLYTTISPDEMLEDPIFHLNPDLGPVDNLRTAQNFRLCDGNGVVTLPDGRVIYVPGGSSWPVIPGEEWYAEEVQTVAIKGAPMTLVNNSAGINKKLDEWNTANDWPRSPEDSTSTGSSSGASEQGEGGGCGCRSEDPRGAAWLGLSALALLARRRRR